MNDNKVLVFDVQRFSIHDGPGIRTTVFLKGCPLSCKWCANPEGIRGKIELMYFQDKCIGCKECMRACKQGAISLKDGRIALDRKKCILCGKCTQECYAGALRFSATYMTVNEIIEKILLDKEFYDSTGGGVTFSGGEPLRDSDALNRMLDACKQNNINTAVETTLYVDFDKIAPLIEKIDHFMVDLKIMDDKLHEKYTGVSNKKILENITRLTKQTEGIVIRTPVIPGVNDNEKELGIIQDFIEQQQNILYWELLPYHRFGENKYDALGLKTQNFGNVKDAINAGRLLRQKTVPIRI